MFSSFTPSPLPRFVDGNKILQIIAPLWQQNDPRDPQTRVYYDTFDLIEKYQHAAVWGAMSRVDHEIQKFKPSSNFSATWMLVVTWHRVTPFPYFRTQDNEVRALVISLPAFREWPVGDRSLASDHLGRLLTKLAADPPAFHRLSQPAFCGQRGRSHDTVYSTPPTPLNKHAVNAASPNRITTSRV